VAVGAIGEVGEQPELAPWVVFAKSADGTEGGTTVSITTPVTTTAAAQVYQIAGWHGTVSSTSIATTTLTTAAGTTVNPGSLTPGWGTDYTLWMPVLFGSDDNVLITVYPLNYGYGLDTVTGSAANSGATVGTARRYLRASSEDPGAFTVASTEALGTLTLGIRPSSTLAFPLTGTPGQLGQAVDFGGDGKYVGTVNAGSGIQTIAFWIKADDQTSRKILNINGVDEVSLDYSGTIFPRSFPGTVRVYVDGTRTKGTLTDNNWHHVVITDSSGLSASTFELGRSAVGLVEYFDGRIDDVRLYNRVLSDAEIGRLYGARTPEPLTTHTYRYVRWSVTDRRGSDNSVQFAEFQLKSGGAIVAWPMGTTATNPGGSNPGSEGPTQAIDSATSTKMLDFNFNLDSGSNTTGSTVLVIDTGSGNSVTFDAYRYQTANDSSNRDPVGWLVHGSNDGINWVLLDSRTGQTITATRQVFTSDYAIP
jgi:hypothetical protein